MNTIDIGAIETSECCRVASMLNYGALTTLVCGLGSFWAPACTRRSRPQIADGSIDRRWIDRSQIGARRRPTRATRAFSAT